MGRFRIHDKIVIPFVLVALVTTVGASLAALSLITKTMESRVQAQVASGAALVSEGLFALNPSILTRVKRVAGGDVITFAAHGEVIATTLDRAQSARLIDAVARDDAGRAAASGGPPRFAPRRPRRATRRTTPITNPCGATSTVTRSIAPKKHASR